MAAAFFDPPSYMAVVAIDFGTTYSGFAFSFLHLEGEPGIHLNKEWGNEQGYQTAKAPTSVLLTEGKDFDKFGYEAAEKYAQLEGDVDRVYFFERFKMLLHHNKDLSRNTKITAKNGQKMLAIDIFAIALRYLKDKALAVISDNTTIEYTISDIQWVITVPAIWEAPAKQFMREAAYKAELATPDNYEQIIIALEPEAASLYCRSLKMKDFSGQHGASFVKDSHARDGSQYLVADIGGGTLDVTVHEIIKGDRVKEIYTASGGSLGGTNVDAAFDEFLSKLFGEEFLTTFKTDHPVHWLELMNEFEVKKRSARITEGTTRIRLPANFIACHRLSGKSVQSEIARLYQPEEVKINSSEFLCIEAGIMQKLFEPTITGIINHLKALLQNPKLSEVKLLFLVGGFAEFPLLQSRIRDEFGESYKILIPIEAKTAVLRGAVMFGKDPEAVQERVLAETYGTSIVADFDPCFDDHDKMTIINGKQMCRNRFCVLAKANEIIKTNESKKTHPFCPVYPNQTAVTFDFYTTTKTIVRYVTDEGVKRLPGRTLTVASPDTSKGTDRTIELKMYFGGTEIKVKAVDCETQNEDNVVLDFLAVNV